MVELNKYEVTTAELEDLGTVKSLVGKGGKIAFIRKNYNDVSKRVVVLLTNANGNSATIPCSKQVSDAFRAKKLTVAQIAGLSVIETKAEDGSLRQFVSMPATGGVEEFAIDKVKEATTEVNAQFIPEELIAF
jgi:hypothetical protein